MLSDYTGDLTYYTSWKGNYGSCGLERSRRDPLYVAALSPYFMKTPPDQPNPNKHPLCAADKCIEIRGARGTVQLKISDTCPECKSFDVDIADEIFPRLDDPIKGRVKVSWKFVRCTMLEGESVKFNEIPSGRRFRYEKSSWTRWIWNR